MLAAKRRCPACVNKLAEPSCSLHACISCQCASWHCPCAQPTCMCTCPLFHVQLPRMEILPPRVARWEAYEDRNRLIR